MAKKQADTDQAPSTDANAPQQGDAKSLWSPEDLARLDSQYTELAQAYTELRTRFEALEARFIAQEAKLAKIDLGEGILPAEIAAGVSPSQVYTSALQASIIAISMASPTGMLSESGRSANMRRVFDTAETALNEALRRTSLGEKKK